MRHTKHRLSTLYCVVKPIDATILSAQTCPSCGNDFTGSYCTQCGEKKLKTHDFSLGHFIEQSIEGITHFDNKFFRTVRNLVCKPGVLTRHFEEGRQVRFMKPMQLFIVCNIIFFLLVGGANIFSVHLHNFLGKTENKVFDTRSHFIKKVGVDANMTHVTELFREKMSNQSKSFIVLFIPFFALACGLLFYRRKKPAGLHLVFATHFFSFLLLFFTLFYLFFEVPNKYIIIFRMRHSI